MHPIIFIIEHTTHFTVLRSCVVLGIPDPPSAKGAEGASNHRVSPRVCAVRMERAASSREGDASWLSDIDAVILLLEHAHRDGAHTLDALMCAIQRCEVHCVSRVDTAHRPALLTRAECADARLTLLNERNEAEAAAIHRLHGQIASVVAALAETGRVSACDTALRMSFPIFPARAALFACRLVVGLH